MTHQNLSPAPGVNQTPTKAYIATGLSALGAFLAALLVVWTDTDPLTSRDFVVALAAAVGTGGVTGVATYSLPNKPTS